VERSATTELHSCPAPKTFPGTDTTSAAPSHTYASGLA
jgi:hypothetical protein